MADQRMTASVVGQAEPIHHATVFGAAGYDTPTTCGKTDQPKPSTTHWQYVTCPACWERAPRDEKFMRAAALELSRAGVRRVRASVVKPTFDQAVVDGVLPSGVEVRIERACDDADAAVLEELRRLPDAEGEDGP